MEVTINVSLRDAERAAEVSTKPWHSVSELEKREYERLIALFGTAVIQKILDK